MGLLDKVYLLFEEAFWDSRSNWLLTPSTGLPPGQFNQWLNLEPALGVPLLQVFNGGPPAVALAGRSDQDIVRRALQALRGGFGIGK